LEQATSYVQVRSKVLIAATMKGSDAVEAGGGTPKFRRNVPPPYSRFLTCFAYASILKMEAVLYSEALGVTSQNTLLSGDYARVSLFPVLAAETVGMQRGTGSELKCSLALRGSSTKS
jgi:hypothetical protein